MKELKWIYRPEPGSHVVNVINLKKIIPVAFEFEMEWLSIRMKNIKNIDRYLYNDYKKRLLEIKKRII